MATNTGGGRKGQIRNRYQLENEVTGLWDKYDSDANYLDSKLTGGPWKGVEKREARKPPRN